MVVQDLIVVDIKVIKGRLVGWLLPGYDEVSAIFVKDGCFR